MSRFFVPPESIHGNTIVVTGKEAHHIIDVMRLAVSDAVSIFDGTGTEYAGVIEEVRPRAVTIRVAGICKDHAVRTRRITLIQAIPKKDKMEYIVEKATELGADIIIPVMAARTIPQWNAPKQDAHLRRWQTIAKEAAKQCGRSDVPKIEGPIGLSAAFSIVRKSGIKLMAALTEDARPLKSVLKEFRQGDVALAIGPEGDFTSEEVALARGAGFSVVDLGPRVLKSDTAGLALLSMVDYEFLM